MVVGPRALGHSGRTGAPTVSYALALLVAALLLFVPGVAVLWSGGRRGWRAWGAAPPVSIALLLLTGAVGHAAASDAVHGAGAVVLAVLTAAVAGAARLIARPVEDPREPSRPRGRWWPAAAVVFGGAVVATVLGRAVGSATAWPQIHDSIFHVGATTMLVRDGSAWAGDVTAYARVPYPGGWHAVAALVTGLSGADPLTASHALLTVVVSVVWPVGVVLLARTVWGPSPAVLITAAVSAFLCYGLPYQLLTWGVVWPFLLATALLSPVLSQVLELTGLVAVAGGRRRIAAAAALPVVGAAAATVVHPAALYGLAVIGLPAVLERLARAGRHRLAVVVAAGGALAVAAAWSVRPPERLLVAGAAGGGYGALDVVALVLSTVSQHPLSAAVGALAVTAGAVLSVRAGHAWVAVGLVVPLALAASVLVLPHGVVSVLTWPWYSDVNRLRALAVVPSVLAVAAVARYVAGRAGEARALVPWGVPVAVAGLAALTLVTAAPVVSALYHPGTADRWWATPAEQDALASLADRLPRGATVAADPFRGGTFLFLHRDVTLLFPVGDPPLPSRPGAVEVAARLDRVRSDPDVCRAVFASGVTHVLTGGDANADETALGDAYAGLARVGSGTPGFTELARSGPYTLWRVDRCTP